MKIEELVKDANDHERRGSHEILANLNGDPPFESKSEAYRYLDRCNEVMEKRGWEVLRVFVKRDKTEGSKSWLLSAIFIKTSASRFGT